MKRIYPRKRFGQHFLHDESVLQRIAACPAIHNDDIILEIGPGKGALTTHLLHRTKNLIVVEIDRDLVQWLNEKFNQTQLMVVEQDILKTDISALLKQQTNNDPKKINIIGNLPYNISTPLIFHLLAQLDSIKAMFFMVQKEVADRLTATQGKKNYGRLTIMANQLTETTHLFDVPAEAFDPPPKVVSSVIEIRPREKAISVNNQEIFSQVVGNAFSQRRKTIRNALKNIIDNETFTDLNIADNLRAENLSVEQFASLANHPRTLSNLSESVD